ncbi:MFS transporter [Candidatus Microgenomates bacterium]|nr:MFS transporter [Candidatus Microgenomates bacterium]
MKTKNIHKNIKLLSWFNFFTDFKLYAPIAIIYFAKVSGSYALGMSVFSIVMLSAALFEIPTGVFSDLIGRKKTIVFGALASVLYAIFYAIGGVYLFLVMGAVFEGLSRSFYSGNNNALLYDTLAESQQEAEYHTFLGKTSSMFQVALAISAIVGSIIAHWSFTWVMWISVVPQILCLFLSFKIIEPANQLSKGSNVFAHTKEALKHFIKNRKLRLLSLTSILSYALGESAYQFTSAFVNTLWPLWAIGIAKALSNIGAAISFYFSGKLIKKYKEFKILIFGNIYSRIINIISLAFPTVLSPALMSTTSLFFGVSSTAKGNLFQKEFTQKQRATMGSLNSLGGSLAFAIISFSLGLLADKIGPIKALFIAQSSMFTILWLYWKLFKETQDSPKSGTNLGLS